MPWISTLQFLNTWNDEQNNVLTEEISYEEKLYKIDEPNFQGTYRQLCLDGFCLERISISLKTDILEHFKIRKNAIGLCFIIEGSIELTSSAGPSKKMNQGFHNICYFPESTGSIKCSRGEYDLFYISVPVDIFHDYLPKNQNLFCQFRKDFQQDKTAFLREKGAFINAKIYRVIQEISECEGTEYIKKIFIKAKILELISFQLEQLCEICKAYAPLNINHAEKMYQVRDFMLKNIGEYYSLNDLAKIVSTNEFTLKKEFKELFGDTVFGFWNEAKMARAREFLLENHKSIKEISEIIGYKNPQHFSTAFKRKFKVSPSNFRKNNL